jgi:hypothetical protein
MKLLLALTLAATQAAAGPLETTQVLSGQLLLPVAKLSVSDTSPDNAAPLIGETVMLGLSAFDPAWGVLTGVRGQLSIDAGQGLMAYRNESGGDWDSVATLRTGWALGAQMLAPLTVLQRVTSNRDTKVVLGTQWSTLAFSTTAGLDAFVGTGSIAPALTTYVGAFINGGGGGATAIASVLNVDGGVGSPDLDGLTGGIQWTYSWLRHAELSFAAGRTQAALSLDLSAGAGSFTLTALGDASTSRADVLGWTCQGDCDAFALQLDAVPGLAAGAAVGGGVSFLGGTGARHATYLLQVADEAGVGAASSRGMQTLTLDVQVAAPVPEPAPALLFWAGLAAMAWWRRR